jgi:hypothetical protein
MATVYRLADLSDDQSKLISVCLTMQPVDKAAEERKTWAHAPRIYTQPKPSVVMFQIEHPALDSETSYLIANNVPVASNEFQGQTPDPLSTCTCMTPSTSNNVNSFSGSSNNSNRMSCPLGTIRLPFRFACSLFKRIVNHDRVYPRITLSNCEPLKFEATLREYQVQPALEAYEQLKTWGSTTLKLPPGFGKTMIGAWLWCLTSSVCAVLVVQQPLLKQWKKTFDIAVPALSRSIWVVGEDPPPGPNVIPAIIICMNQRTSQIPTYIKDAVACLIIDEAHCFCTPDRVDALLAFTPKYVIAETATLERDDGMEKMIHSICGEHSVYRAPTTRYLVLKLDTSIAVEEKRNRYGVDFGDLCTRLCALPERNNIIVNIVKQNPHRKFMILTRLADHVRLLNLLITQIGIQCATLYRNQKTYSDSPVLIGTIPKIGTGFDEANACEDFGGVQSDTLILANSIKKNTVFEQVRGRIMRSSSPVVIYLVDRNSVCKRHFRETVPWIESTQGTVIQQTYYPDTVVLPASLQSSSTSNTGVGMISTSDRYPSVTSPESVANMDPSGVTSLALNSHNVSPIRLNVKSDGGSSNPVTPVKLRFNKDSSSSPTTPIRLDFTDSSPTTPTALTNDGTTFSSEIASLSKSSLGSPSNVTNRIQLKIAGAK